MPDTPPGAETLEPPREYWTVEAAAFYTGRSPEMIRRYARDKLITHIEDPSDRRRILIPVEEMVKVVRQPKRGRHRKAVTFTLSDGSIITRVLAVED